MKISKKNIELLEVKKQEIITTLSKPINKEFGVDEILVLTEKLVKINNALSYLTINYLD